MVYCKRGITKKRIVEYVLFILMGMLCFSTLGTEVAQNYLHFPLSLPELFFVPLYYILRDNFRPVRCDKGLLAKLMFVLVFLVLWSQLMTEFPLYSVLSSARGYLYIFLFLCVYKTNTGYRDEAIMWICFGSIVGWFISSRLSFQQMIVETDETFQSNGNMIAIAIFMFYTIFYKRWKFFFIGLLIILCICVFSGIRRVVFVTAASFVIAVLIQLLKGKGSLIKQTALVGVIIIPIAIAIPVLDERIEEINPILHYRLFGKTEMIFQGESSESDDLRKSNINKYLGAPLQNIIPRGMVSNQYYTDKGAGIFMDLPFFALIHLFGFPLAILIIVYFGICSLKCIAYYRKNNEVAAGVYGAMGSVFIMLLFVEGSFLVYPFVTPFTGLCLGRMVYYSKKDVRKSYNITSV